MFTLGFFWDFQIAIAILWLFYRIVLWQRVTLSLERVYLLLIIPSSLLFASVDLPILEPTIVVEKYVPVMNFSQSEILISQPEMSLPVESIDIWELIYWAGAVMVAIWGMAVIVRFVFMVCKSKNIDGIHYTSRRISGCSFFSIILVGRQYIDSPRLDEIVSHERVHGRYLHSLDLIYIWLTSIILWFNPVVWLTMRSLRMVHEAQADRGVISQGHEPLRYIDTLLRAEAGFDYIPFNSLSYSLTKNRIKMITKKQPRHGALRLVMALPLVGAMLFMFSFTSPTIVVSDADTNFQSVVVTTNTNSPSFHTTTSGSDSVIVTSSIFKINSTDYAVILSKQKTTNGNGFFFTSRGISKEEFEKIDPFMIEKIEIMNSKGNTPSDMISITMREKPNKDAAIYVMAGPDVQMGTITNITVSLRKMGATTITYQAISLKLNTEGKETTFNNVVVAPYGKKGKSSNVTIDNVVVTSYGQSNKLTSVANKVTVDDYAKNDRANTMTIKMDLFNPDPGKEPLVMVTLGENTKEITLAELKQMGFESIKLFSVLKDSSSVAIYGERAKNGVIIATLKDQNDIAEHQSRMHELLTDYYKTTNDKYPVLLKWKGKEAPTEMKYADFKNIKKENIKSLRARRDSLAVAKFEERGNTDLLIVELNEAP